MPTSPLDRCAGCPCGLSWLHPWCGSGGLRRPRQAAAAAQRMGADRAARCSPPTSAASTACCARRCRTTSCCRSCRWCASASRSIPARVRYWYDLLGSIHVTFAVCSANGRVLAAIDLDTDRGNSRRVLQIKQSVLGACRVRYLRCPVDHLPSVAELQLLVPQAGADARGPQAAAAPPAHAAPGPRHAGQHRRAPPRRAHGAVAGLLAVPGFVLRAGHALRRLQARASSAASAGCGSSRTRPGGSTAGQVP